MHQEPTQPLPATFDDYVPITESEFPSKSLCDLLNSAGVRIDTSTKRYIILIDTASITTTTTNNNTTRTKVPGSQNGPETVRDVVDKHVKRLVIENANTNANPPVGLLALIDAIERAWSDTQVLHRCVLPMQCTLINTNIHDNSHISTTNNISTFPSNTQTQSNTKDKPNRYSSYGNSVQDTLAKIFLSVKALQVPLSNTLFHRIVELANEADLAMLQAGDVDHIHGNNISAHTEYETNLPKLALHQLRWMTDHGFDNVRQVTEHMLATITSVPAPMQAEIISMVPEIVNSSASSTFSPALSTMVVTTLLDLVREHVHLIPSVLETVSFFQVDTDQMEDFIETAIRLLPSADQECIPAMIKFILRSLDKDNAPKILTGLRNSFEMDDLNPDICRLVYESLVQGFRLRPHTTAYILKALKDDSVSKKIDLWLYFTADASGASSQAMNIMKKKLGAGQISKDVFCSSILPFGKYCRDICNRVVRMLAASISSNAQKHTKNVVSSILSFLYVHVEDPLIKRNIVISLTELIGTCPSQSARNVSLLCLLKIALDTRGSRELQENKALIESTLDFVETFSVFQLRCIFATFFAMRQPGAYLHDGATVNGSGDGEMDSVDQALSILIRKELTHPDPRYQRLGIVGATTMIRLLAGANECSREPSGVAGSSSIVPALSPLASQKIDELIKLLRIASSNQLTSARHMYEELSFCFANAQIQSEVANKVRNRLIIELKKYYLRSCEDYSGPACSDSSRSSPGFAEAKPSEGKPTTPPDERSQAIAPSKPHHLWGNLDDQEAAFYVPVYDFCSGNSQDKASIQLLCPLLDVVVVATVATEGESAIDELDGILGAPLQMPTEESIASFDSAPSTKKHGILLSMWIAISWIRQCLIAFGSHCKQEYQRHCITRIAQLIKLEAMFTTLMEKQPSFLDEILQNSIPDIHQPFDFHSKSANLAPVAPPVSVFFEFAKTGPHSPADRHRAPTGAGRGFKSKSKPDTFTAFLKPLQTGSLKLLSHFLVPSVESKNASVTDSFEVEYFLLRTLYADFHSWSTKSSASSEIAVLDQVSQTWWPCSRDEFHAFEQPLRAVSELLFRYMNGFAGCEKIHQVAAADESNGKDERSSASPDETAEFKVYLCCQILSSVVAHITKKTCMTDMDHNALIHIFGMENTPTGQVQSNEGASHTQRKALSMEKARLCEQTLVCFASKTLLTSQAASSGLSFAALFALVHMNHQLQAALTRHFPDLGDSDESSVTRKEMSQKIQDLVWATFAKDCSPKTTNPTAKHLYSGLKFDAMLTNLISLWISESSDDRVGNVQKLMKITKAYVKKHVHDSLVDDEENRGDGGRDSSESDDENREEDDQFAQTRPLLTLHNVDVYLKALLQESMAALKMLNRATNRDATIQDLSHLIELFNDLLMLCREREKTFGACLKFGQMFVEYFMKTFLAQIDEMLKSPQDCQDASLVLRTCQKLTRYLQRLGMHVKNAYPSLASHVPPLRKTLESFIYKVKAIFKKRKVLDTFRIGNLKHRDIYGRDLPTSQMIRPDSSEEEQDDDDDDDNDEKDEEGNGEDIEDDIEDEEGRNDIIASAEDEDEDKDEEDENENEDAADNIAPPNLLVDDAAEDDDDGEGMENGTRKSKSHSSKKRKKRSGSGKAAKKTKAVKTRGHVSDDEPSTDDGPDSKGDAADYMLFDDNPQETNDLTLTGDDLDTTADKSVLSPSRYLNLDAENCDPKNNHNASTPRSSKPKKGKLKRRASLDDEGL